MIAAIPLVGFIDQIYLNETDQPVVVEQRITQVAEVIGGEVDNWVDKNTLSSTFLANMDAAALVPVLNAAMAVSKPLSTMIRLVFP